MDKKALAYKLDEIDSNTWLMIKTVTNYLLLVFIIGWVINYFASGGDYVK